MPKMFVHTRKGILSHASRAQVATSLTNLGMECEHLSDKPDVRKGIWIFFSEHADEYMFQGGEVAVDPIASIIVFALEGGLDDKSRSKLIAGITSILGEHTVPSGAAAPVYVAIRDIPEANWGMYGQQVSLASLRAE